MTGLVFYGTINNLSSFLVISNNGFYKWLIFNQLKITSYKEFLEYNESEALVAGTIMSIQEKKSSKGTPFAIIKFTDISGEFELFLFSELLTKNRDKLKESSSFILTLHKDLSVGDKIQRRINIRNILDISDVVNNSYKNVSIELNNGANLDELKETLKEEGKTAIKIIVKNNNKKLIFELEKARKFNFSLFNHIKNMENVKKISF